MDSIDRTSRGTCVSLPDFTEQLDATDEHLARWHRASLNRSRASRRPRRSGWTSIRSSNPEHNQVVETTTRLELFKETVHVNVKITSSTPSYPLTARSQDPGREGHANISAACRKHRTVSNVQRPKCQANSWESAVKRQQ